MSSLVVGVWVIAIAALIYRRLVRPAPEIRNIAQADQVRRLLASIAGDYRRSGREAWAGFFIAALLGLLVGGRVAGGLIALCAGPGYRPYGSDWLVAVLSCEPALIAGGLIFVSFSVAGWVQTRNEATCIREGHVTQHYPLMGSWTLVASRIRSVGLRSRSGSDNLSLVLETHEGSTRSVRVSGDLRAALGERIASA
jgi:hypothetical protein